MSIHLDHVMVPARDRRTSAKLLGRIFAAPWAETGIGPFCPVYLSDTLTLDVDQAEGEVQVLHYCFHMSDSEFDALVERLRDLDIVYRSLPNGPADMAINTALGGRIVYWSQPDGHMWEALTASYARMPASWGDPAHDSEMD